MKAVELVMLMFCINIATLLLTAGGIVNFYDYDDNDEEVPISSVDVSMLNSDEQTIKVSGDSSSEGFVVTPAQTIGIMVGAIATITFISLIRGGGGTDKSTVYDAGLSLIYVVIFGINSIFLNNIGVSFDNILGITSDSIISCVVLFNLFNFFCLMLFVIGIIAAEKPGAWSEGV